MEEEEGRREGRGKGEGEAEEVEEEGRGEGRREEEEEERCRRKWERGRNGRSGREEEGWTVYHFNQNGRFRPSGTTQ